jgi:GNAT superfamily N-acetyltransferase
MAFVVRRVASGDVHTLKATRLAALFDTPFAFGSTHAVEAAQSDEHWKQRVARASRGSESAMFLATAGDDVLGLVGGYRPDPAVQVVELVSMWTAPHARRRGVGRALALSVIEWATATGADSVALWVTIGNEPAEAFYASLEFVPTGEEQPVGPGRSEDEARMVLRIAGS